MSRMECGSRKPLYKTATIKLFKTFIIALDTATTGQKIMVYNNTKEFQYLKPKNSYLQTFRTTTGKPIYNTRTPPPPFPTTAAAPSPTTKNNSWWNLLQPYFKEYCNTSSIHCFHYFTDNKLKYYEKAIWFLIMVATSVCCTIVYFDLAELYYTQRVQTTVADSVHPIFVVPFPSVGICLRNRIDWTRLHNQAAKRFLPPNVDNETLHTFYRFFESLSDVKFYYLSRFSHLFHPSSKVNLTLIDGVNVLEVLQYLTFPCSQVFSTTCLWRLKTYNCCELFTLERTELGFCYVFNSAVSQKAKDKAKANPFYPYHNSYSGEGTGLDVEVLLNEQKMKPGTRMVNGIYVMIKHPEQWHADVKFINYNTFTKLSLTAQLTETDSLIKHITPVSRGCLFDEENTHFMYKKIPGLIYWRGNCRTRCHQEYVLKFCKCNLNILFPEHKSDNFTSCKPSDFKCIYEHANIFSRETHLFESKYIDDLDNESMTCNCLNSCKQLLYHAFYSSFPLEGVEAADPIKMVHLDIHFQAAYLLKYRTAMRYTFVELLANFGGIIGLFLGASLLSAVELVYFFTLGLYIRLHKQFEQKYRNKPPNSHIRHVKPKMVKISTIEQRGFYKY